VPQVPTIMDEEAEYARIHERGAFEDEYADDHQPERAA